MFSVPRAANLTDDDGKLVTIYSCNYCAVAVTVVVYTVFPVSVTPSIVPYDRRALLRLAPSLYLIISLFATVMGGELMTLSSRNWWPNHRTDLPLSRTNEFSL